MIFRTSGRMIATAIMGILIAFILFVAGTYNYVTVDETPVYQVTDKERVTKSNSDGKVSSYYLIFTDEETLSNEDNIFFFKFDSSDLYGHLNEGSCYIFEVNSFRISFFSMYRNILDYEEVPCKENR